MAEKEKDLNNEFTMTHQTRLEREYIEEFLRKKGYSRHDLSALPADEARKLLAEACMYATMKLVEQEAGSKFFREIRIR